MINNPLICQLFNQDFNFSELTEEQWSAVLELAYAANIMARLSYFLRACGGSEFVPESLRWHFRSAEKTYETHRRDVGAEVKAIRQALSSIGVLPVLLKGSAYVESELKVADGRLFNDIDIYVPEIKLPAVEELLRWHHWKIDEIDEYNESYYRRWMHELPPMVNLKTGVSLDVHHRLLPKTCRLELKPEDLCINPTLSAKNGVQVLEDEDLLLHSMTHLFFEGEFGNGFRDLLDIYWLLNEFSNKPGFYERLLSAAERMGVSRILFYSIRYSALHLGVSVPEAFSTALLRHSPGKLHLTLMDFCYSRALLPVHPNTEDKFSGLARGLLYLRSHWLRMPLRLLIPHLCHKAFITPVKEKETKATEALN